MTHTPAAGLGAVWLVALFQPCRFARAPAEQCCVAAQALKPAKETDTNQVRFRVSWYLMHKTK